MLNKIRSLNSIEEIKKELRKCKKDELLIIANELQLVGTKSMSKEKLIDFIATTQKYRIEFEILKQVDIRAGWQK